MASDRDQLIGQLARSLRYDLPSSAVVAEQPDHPLLFAGPDIIVGSDGNLVAAFFPKAREFASWKSLQSRLTAVRLALPAHAKCIMVSGEAGSLPDDLTEGSFDEVYSPREADSTKMLMHGTSRTLARAPRLLEIRQQAMINYSAILHVHRMQASRWEADAVAMSQDSKRTDRRSRSPIKFGESRVGELGGRSRSSVLASLQTFVRKAFVENYDLMDGVPELKRHALDVAIHDSDMRRGMDPGKPLRAAAFAGWLLKDSPVAGDLEHYIMTSEREFDRTRERLWSLQQRRSVS
ncbi:hypothetical protein F9K81_13785 [Brucella anthropi]|uniref:hypothetical protein n=1 Tax=Brucella anthropi TaxID=529 RepID=UPI00124E5561|nr:hypothetical protein [Brucella anthropi]KAB2756961.1 hypothetical protein F9K81_13785 [Brucella anthropi]